MAKEADVSFDTLWKDIEFRCHSKDFPMVQNREELEHVFNLMQGCDSYLEVGTAEGNSLHVLAHALKPSAHITYVDLGEKHTEPKRREVEDGLKKDGYDVRGILGNSVHREVIERASDRLYDVVLIDAGHSFDEALSDAKNYGELAKKYLIFHDVCLPDVNRAFSIYIVNLRPKRNHYKFIRSESFGYGIIET